MELDLPTISKKIKIEYVSELGMIYYRYFLHSQMETVNTPLSGNFCGVTESCHLMTMSCT